MAHTRCLIPVQIYFILVSVNILGGQAFAQQNPLKQMWQLSRPEKCWVLFHPFIAKKAFILTQKAIQETNKMKQDPLLDGNESGGQVDAFRHAYWMALLAQQLNPRKACRLGRAHEKGNKIDFRKGRMEEGILPDSVSSVMDMENNSRGIAIGCENRNLTEKELQFLVREAVLKGTMKIIRRDKDGNFLDCEGKPIRLEAWSRKWNIPKCLVNSNDTSRFK